MFIYYSSHRKRIWHQNLPTLFTVPYISPSQLVRHKGLISLPPREAGWGLGQKSYQAVQRPWVTRWGRGAGTTQKMSFVYVFLHHGNCKASKYGKVPGINTFSTPCLKAPEHSSTEYEEEWKNVSIPIDCHPSGLLFDKLRQKIFSEKEAKCSILSQQENFSGKTSQILKQLFSPLRLHPQVVSPSLSPSLPGLGSGDAKASGAQALGTDLMGREGSPASHQSFGGLMYMHHSSQLYPWAEFSYRCTSKVSCLMLSMEGRITRFRFSWIRESTGSALKHREVEIKTSLLGFPGSPVVKNPPCNTRDTGSIPGPGRPHMRQGN